MDERSSRTVSRVPAISPVDLAVGAAFTSAALAAPVLRRAVAVASPVVGLVLRPPLLARRHQPVTWAARLARRGEEHRRALRVALESLLDDLAPFVVQELLRRVDLTDTVRRHLDLDAVVADVDLDAAAARLDIDAVARRLDLDGVVARLDLTRIVRDQLDLDALVATVDLDAAAARLDVAAVIDRVDLVGLAQAVIAEIDLPEIIRESTGSVASETVRGVRMQGISGDQAVSRAIDRFRHRHDGPVPGGQPP